MGKKKYKDEKLCRELEAYRNAGVGLTLNGRPSTPKKISQACRVSEKKGTYMRDYVRNEDGEVETLGFHFIKYK